MFRLLFDTQAVAALVKLRHAVTLGVTHAVAEHGRLAVLFGIHDSLLQHIVKSRTVEDVVAQYKTGTVVSYELFTDNESLCQSVR